MQEPTPRTGRLAIAGALVALALAGGAGFWVGRSGVAEPIPAPAASPVVAPRPVASEEAEGPPRALGRFELAALAGEAADALSSGTAPPSALVESVGRQVEVTLPFGCTGPLAANDPATGWRYDTESGALRVRVRPVQWQAADWNLSEEDGSVTGFWLSRPWASGDRCPVPSRGDVSEAQAVTLPGQTVALGFFPAPGERAMAPDRVFEVVQRAAPTAAPGPAGLRMRVIGRLGSGPGGGPVRCVQPAGIDQRPICIVAIRPETLRLEDAGTGATLGEWAPGAD